VTDGGSGQAETLSRAAHVALLKDDIEENEEVDVGAGQLSGVHHDR
jgi:hypothetical protein